MSIEPVVFGPDNLGETVIVELDGCEVVNVILQGPGGAPIPLADLSKEQWTKMAEAEDAAIQRLRAVVAESAL